MEKRQRRFEKDKLKKRDKRKMRKCYMSVERKKGGKEIGRRGVHD